MRTIYVIALILAGLAAGISSHVRAENSNPQTLMDAYRIIHGRTFVDLTHDFAPGVAHWHGFPNESVKTLYWYTAKPGTLGSGFFAQLFCHVGQWGTHVDPPAHFDEKGITMDEIPLKQMILPSDRAR